MNLQKAQPDIIYKIFDFDEHILSYDAGISIVVRRLCSDTGFVQRGGTYGEQTMMWKHQEWCNT